MRSFQLWPKAFGENKINDRRKLDSCKVGFEDQDDQEVMSFSGKPVSAIVAVVWSWRTGQVVGGFTLAVFVGIVGGFTISSTGFFVWAGL